MNGLAPTPGALSLDAAQREVLLEEIETLAGSLRDPRLRGPYDELATAVADGEVGQDLLGRLERVLEITLETGRTRRVHGAESEQALLRLFHQTPGGAAARRTTQAVNEALATLEGQALEGMLFTVQGPGVFRLGLRTDRCRLTLEIDRSGVSVESLEV
ncbi:MAG TPA: hypothetical protein VGG03_14525 [Thermoanaerobaculia bacterium]